MSEKKTLRVLHIANIANNAYLNAKLLNKNGLDCDVLCYDYYHIMGCPEWEDANFVGQVSDQFRPNWRAVDLRGFERPHWFAQGPFRTCVRYLLARRRGQARRARFWWWVMDMQRWMLAAGISAPRRILLAPLRIARRLKNLARRWLWQPIHAAFGLGRGIYRRARAQGLRTGLAYYLRRIRGAPADALLDVPPAPDADRPPPTPYQRRAAALIARFGALFPDRSDPLTFDDLVGWQKNASLLKALFAEYDIIQAYATDPILPLVVGKRPYVAFEHGTIRSIPFEATRQGRITALSYRLADGVLITNADNKRAAERLQLPNYRFVPHPINERWFLPDVGAALRTQLKDMLDADFLIFHPARQHWEARRHPSWEKGNDILIKGMARFIKEVAPRAAAVFVAWGQMIDESKALLAELGIADRVKWIEPVHMADMARYTDACDVLADQFYLGAFGSTMPRALAQGTPSLICLDEDIHRWCFDAMPPVINVRTPDAVYRGLKRAYEDPDWLGDLAERGIAWYRRYHSNRVIYETLSRLYDELVPPDAEADR